MAAFASILSHSVSRELFHERIEKRLAPQAKAIREQVERIEREFPQLKSDVISQADLAMLGRLILPGMGGQLCFVGHPPRWLDNPVNDQEYSWTLNRMGHWVPLLRGLLPDREGSLCAKSGG